jgi:hypothetical protein
MVDKKVGLVTYSAMYGVSTKPDYDMTAMYKLTGRGYYVYSEIGLVRCDIHGQQ